MLCLFIMNVFISKRVRAYLLCSSSGVCEQMSIVITCVHWVVEQWLCVSVNYILTMLSWVWPLGATLRTILTCVWVHKGSDVELVSKYKICYAARSAYYLLINSLKMWCWLASYLQNIHWPFFAVWTKSCSLAFFNFLEPE